MSAAAATLTTASCCTIGQSGNDPAMPEPTFEELLDAMKDGRRRAPARRDPVRAGRRALRLGARRPEERARRRLHDPAGGRRRGARRDRGGGLGTERPPEGWLYKTWHANGALIDLIFGPPSGPITDEHDRARAAAEVMALRVHVFTLEDVMSTKLMAMTEQEPDFGAVLELRACAARADRLETRCALAARPRRSREPSSRSSRASASSSRADRAQSLFVPGHAPVRCAKPVAPARSIGGLDAAEDRPLDRRRGQDLAPALVRVGRVRRILFTGDGLPHALEDRPGHETAEDAEEQTERLVEKPSHVGELPRTSGNHTSRLEEEARPGRPPVVAADDE